MGFLNDWFAIGRSDWNYIAASITRDDIRAMLPLLRGQIHPDNFVKTCKAKNAVASVKDTLYHFRIELDGNYCEDEADQWYKSTTGKRQLPGDVRSDLYHTHKNDIELVLPEFQWNDKLRKLVKRRFLETS